MSSSRQKNRQPHDDEPREIRRQSAIFLGTLALMLVFLISLYVSVRPVFSAGLAIILLVSTIGLYIKYRTFYALRDRGQRTWCAVISLYVSLVCTVACAYYYSLNESLTNEYALVFLFGFLFFTYMIYCTLSRTMVVGNKRIRIR